MPFRWLDMMIAVTFFTLGSCGREGAKVSQTQELSYPLNPGAHVTVEARNGKITVLGWDKEEVRVKITKTVWAATRERAEARFEEVRIDLDHQPDRFSAREMRVRSESRFWDLLDPDRWAYGGREVRVDYDLRIPRHVNLSIENEEGNVVLDGVTAENVKVDVGEGNVRVRGFQATNVDLFTDEGNIDGEVEFVGTGQSRLRTREGNVTLALIGAPDVVVNLATEEGVIRTDYPLRVTDFEEGQRARGTIGTGQGHLEISTEEGNILLEKSRSGS